MRLAFLTRRASEHAPALEYWCLRLATGAIAASALLVEFAAAQTAASDAPPAASDPAPAAGRGPLSTGLYAGELFKGGLPEFFYRPQDSQFTPSYVAVLNFDYRAYKFEHLPLQFETEFDIGKRFHGANQWDFEVAPFFRWTSLPWNKWLYTNVRVGALGASYATGISAWERQNSGNDKGSRWLEFLVPELTFASGPNSRGEAFIRVHHRSGLYGLINGVSGGSNYLSVGYRVFW